MFFQIFNKLLNQFPVIFQQKYLGLFFKFKVVFYIKNTYAINKKQLQYFLTISIKICKHFLFRSKYRFLNIYSTDFELNVASLMSDNVGQFIRRHLLHTGLGLLRNFLFIVADDFFHQVVVESSCVNKLVINSCLVGRH